MSRETRNRTKKTRNTKNNKRKIKSRRAKIWAKTEEQKKLKVEKLEIERKLINEKEEIGIAREIANIIK